MRPHNCKTTRQFREYNNGGQRRYTYTLQCRNCEWYGHEYSVRDARASVTLHSILQGALEIPREQA